MTTSRPRSGVLPISLVSLASGVLGALGILVLLQQAGSVYPTRTITIMAAVLGVAWGIAVPVLARIVGAHRSTR